MKFEENVSFDITCPWCDTIELNGEELFKDSEVEEVEEMRLDPYRAKRKKPYTDYDNSPLYRF